MRAEQTANVPSEVANKLAERGFVSVNLVTSRIGYSRSAVANMLKAHTEIEVVRYKRLRYVAWGSFRALLKFADTVGLPVSATELLLGISPQKGEGGTNAPANATVVKLANSKRKK